MILSTATPESPLLFQCVFIFGRRRSPTANLTVLPAGRCQKQIWAPLWLLAGIMHALEFSVENMTKNRHPYKQKTDAKLPHCPTPRLLGRPFFSYDFIRGQIIPTEILLTHSGSFTAEWIFIQFMNCIGRKGTEQFLDELPWALASKRQRYLHTFSLNSSISKIRA